MKKTFLLLLIFWLQCGILWAYTDQEICDAIYIIEGEEKSSQPYGINPQYFKCETKGKCKQICLNTVKNNRKRYAEYGYKQYDTYLEFLASRYCPSSEYLCENWLPNLKFYLQTSK